MSPNGSYEEIVVRPFDSNAFIKAYIFGVFVWYYVSRDRKYFFWAESRCWPAPGATQASIAWLYSSRCPFQYRDFRRRRRRERL